MATEKQFAANQANAQHSTGPKSDEGKATSCMNNFRWGFCGSFTVLPSEDQDGFDILLAGLHAEYKPRSTTETILVEKMAQTHWLSQRAVRLQGLAMADGDGKQFSLFLRYQTTNDRAFHKCLNDLLKVRAEKRKAEIGFESQELKRQEEARKQSVEKRKQDVHRMDVLLAQAKADHQIQLNLQLEHSMQMSSFSENRAAQEHKAA